MVVFAKAHKYIESPDLVAGLMEVLREMRHKGTSILVASQAPPVRTRRPHRTLQPDHPVQVQLAGLAQAYPKGQCRLIDKSF